MHILFVVPYAPNLIRTRPYNLIRSLHRRGHAITVLTLWESAQERESLRRLEEDGMRVVCAPLTKTRSVWNALRALPTRIPLQAVYCWQPALLHLFDSHLSKEPFDIVHVEHLRGARYGLWLKAYRLGSNPRVGFIWDSVDCISYLFEQAAHSSRSLFGKLVTPLELSRTRRYEGWLVRQFDQVLVTSHLDKSALERLADDTAPAGIASAHSDAIAVLPNGVDLDFFSPTEQGREQDTVVFSGKMSYHANITAVLFLINEIMPLVWAKRPGARVWIVGKDPPAAVRQLAVRNPQRVVVTGTVADIRPYLARAAVAACAVRYGAGIQNKVLEAMAMATPVVATRQAVSALQVRDGEHVLIGDDAETLAQMILSVLGDLPLQQRLGWSGRQYAERYHDWNSITARLETLYQSAV
jgi:glycosyltransferase involved in cell wall biosynthesis